MCVGLLTNDYAWYAICQRLLRYGEVTADRKCVLPQNLTQSG